MYHMKTVHVLQPICGVGQLDESVRLATTGYNATTYELYTIHSLMLPGVPIDVHREKGETLMIRNEVYKPSIS